MSDGLAPADNFGYEPPTLPPQFAFDAAPDEYSTPQTDEARLESQAMIDGGTGPSGQHYEGTGEIDIYILPFAKQYEHIMQESKSQVENAATSWSTLKDAFDAAATKLYQEGDKLSEGWDSAEASALFLAQVGAATYSFRDWRDSAGANSTSLSTLASAIGTAQSEMTTLYGQYEKDYAQAQLLQRTLETYDPDNVADGSDMYASGVPRNVDLYTGIYQSGPYQGLNLVGAVNKKYQDLAKPKIETLTNAFMDSWIALRTGGVYKGLTNANLPDTEGAQQRLRDSMPSPSVPAVPGAGAPAAPSVPAVPGVPNLALTGAAAAAAAARARAAAAQYGQLQQRLQDWLRNPRNAAAAPVPSAVPAAVPVAQGVPAALQNALSRAQALQAGQVAPAAQGAPGAQGAPAVPAVPALPALGAAPSIAGLGSAAAGLAGRLGAPAVPSVPPLSAPGGRPATPGVPGLTRPSGAGRPSGLPALPGRNAPGSARPVGRPSVPALPGRGAPGLGAPGTRVPQRPRLPALPGRAGATPPGSGRVIPPGTPTAPGGGAANSLRGRTATPSAPAVPRTPGLTGPAAPGGLTGRRGPVKSAADQIRSVRSAVRSALAGRGPGPATTGASVTAARPGPTLPGATGPSVPQTATGPVAGRSGPGAGRSGPATGHSAAGAGRSGPAAARSATGGGGTGRPSERPVDRETDDLTVDVLGDAELFDVEQAGNGVLQAVPAGSAVTKSGPAIRATK